MNNFQIKNKYSVNRIPKIPCKPMQNNTTTSQPIYNNATNFNDKTGALVIIIEETYKYRIHSIYKAEAHSLEKSLDIIIDIVQHNSNFIIYTDSQSTLQSLGRFNCKTTNIKNVQE